MQRRYGIALCSLALSLICSGCGSGGLTPPVITIQPADQNSTLGQTATFSVAATSSGPRSYQWQRGGNPIAGATLPFYTTLPLAMSDSGTQYNVVVSNPAGTATSNTAKLTVIAVTDVVTYHNDAGRTGQNLTETLLTPTNVNSTQFGKLGVYSADGLVDAQPLYVGSVAVPNHGKHNLLIVATEHGSVYAYDADSGATIWRASTLGPGETSSDDLQCGAVTPEIGVTATPVIDRWRGANGAVDLVAMTEDSAGNYHQRLHALDLAQGTELFGGPSEIHATYPGTGDNSDGTNVIFDPAQYFERAALLLLNDTIYMSWASHCDVRPYTGWIMGYSASTLEQVSVLNITPNAGQGAIWMSAGGLAADNAGNVFLAQGNGYFDPTLNAAGFPNEGDYGNGFIKLSTIDGLSVTDYFEMDAQKAENTGDIDLGAGGVLLLPDLANGSGQTLHLATSAGKDGNLYVLNRDALGKSSSDDQNLYQKLVGVLPRGIWSTPAYFNNTIYFGPVFSPIRALSIGDAKISANSVAQTPNTFGYPGATPSISANGKNNGIVWAVETVTITSPAVLHAYDAVSLNELYNSNQASGSRDLFGNGNKYITPTIANGKVFVGTPNGVAVFGLLQ